MNTLSTLLLIYVISLLINLVFAVQFWWAYRTTTYKKLAILWLLTTLNFLLQAAVSDSLMGSLLTFPTYIFVAYYACSLLTETSSIPFNFRPFNIIYLFSLLISLTLYKLDFRFTFVAIPVAIGVAAPQLFFALLKLSKYRRRGTQFGNSFAVLLLLNGIHFLDFPFLRPDPQMAIFGFGLVLIYSVGFAALLPSILNKHHTDRSDHLLNEIKKRERAEKELAASLEKAEHLTNVKSIFLANVSHEIRTPLTGIIGLNDLLLTTELNPEQNEYCKDIADASQKLRRIINNVLNLSKLESGTVVVEQEKFALASVVSEVRSHYSRHNKSGIEITCTSADDIPDVVIGDKGKIQQIIFNLMDNAIKYSQSEWIKLQLSYNFEKKIINIFVSDNGVGIPPEIANQLFLRFKQKDSNTEGVGLGLSIVAQLTALMSGEISVKSEPGKGVVFSCNIPANIADAVNNPNDFSKETISKKIHKNSTFNLLLIDDNVLNLKTVASLLTQAGYRCILAETGEMAKKLYQENSIDLILTDIQLPDVNGFDLIRYFRENNSSMPIVAYSAFAFDEDVAAAVTVGATDYLRKPAMFAEIQAKLNHYLE
ncbi:MAG: response regulator [Gammaproteobacteria bacterium]|nr:MAG: response regulator [Gammaproteobacteria bacterium]